MVVDKYARSNVHRAHQNEAVTQASFCADAFDRIRDIQNFVAMLGLYREIFSMRDQVLSPQQQGLSALSLKGPDQYSGPVLLVPPPVGIFRSGVTRRKRKAGL